MTAPTWSRRAALAALAGLPTTAAAARRVSVVAGASAARLEVDGASWRFARGPGGWAFEGVWVRGKKTAMPIARADGFFVGGGLASACEIVANDADGKELRFTGLGPGGATVSYRVSARDPWPRVRVAFEGRADTETVCAFRTPGAGIDQRGAWATRGETATDAEGREVFVDGSGRLVFGHSLAAGLDTAYVVQVEVKDNIHPRGRSAQPSGTFFGSRRVSAGAAPHGEWRLRLGAAEPKAFSVAFDRDLGGRLHDVCEAHYAGAVASQLDVAGLRDDYDPVAAIDLMPLRLSAPESFIPGYGWHMEEYWPGHARAAYPYGEDSGIQTAALLAFEGHATGRAWEKGFGKYVVDNMPLWGGSDERAYFVEREGGYTRWAYYRDYANDLPLMEGGNWTAAEHLWSLAQLSGDETLRARALALCAHDVNVKLDLPRMTFPPCWNPQTSRLDDHRDDWDTTAGLGYCAVIAARILHPATKDAKYLRIADRITDWLRARWGPEERMNFLHPGVNTFHCFMSWLPRALIERTERTGDPAFLDIAKDLAWVMFLTLGVTSHRDVLGRPLAGVTCVGVRGCVDYDCTPNLCHEKDLAFLGLLGDLAPHVSGAAYAPVVALHRFVLARDRWKEAFWIQEQRGVNLRTNYDNYARGMTNLAFGLSHTEDRTVVAYETLVPRRDLEVARRRRILLANPTATARATKLRVGWLRPGRYEVKAGAKVVGTFAAEALAAGVDVTAPAGVSSLHVTALGPEAPEPAAPTAFDESVTFLSDLPIAQGQRGIGLPTPIVRPDAAFGGGPLVAGGQTYGKGLGLAANTVLRYDLGRRHRRFRGTIALAPTKPEGQAKTASKPAPVKAPESSVILTIFVDGRCVFASGRLDAARPTRAFDVDTAGARDLVLRLSSGFDDGVTSNDEACLCDAKLIGRARA